MHGKMIILHDADEFIVLALCVTAFVVCQDFFKLQPFEGIWSEGRLPPGDDVHELFVAAPVSGHVVLPLTEQVVTANEGCDFGNRRNTGTGSLKDGRWKRLDGRRKRLLK